MDRSTTGRLHIAVVSIPVTDQEAAKQFYTEKLDFEVLRDNAMGPDQRWVQLGFPEAEASITLVTWFKQMPPGSMQGIVLETNDVEAAFNRLKERGVAVSPWQDAPWGRFATFTDPDGNGWVLQQTSPDA